MEYHNTAVPDVTDADSCSESNPEFRARHEATGEAASECARTQKEDESRILLVVQLEIAEAWLSTSP